MQNQQIIRPIAGKYMAILHDVPLEDNYKAPELIDIIKAHGFKSFVYIGPTKKPGKANVSVKFDDEATLQLAKEKLSIIKLRDHKTARLLVPD